MADEHDRLAVRAHLAEGGETRLLELLVADGEHLVEELARVLAVGGSLLFSVPAGRPRVYFNAHHTPEQILQYFDQLELAEFSVVNDRYELIHDAGLDEAAALTYGCGLFRFQRTSSET